MLQVDGVAERERAPVDAEQPGEPLGDPHVVQRHRSTEHQLQVSALGGGQRSPAALRAHGGLQERRGLAAHVHHEAPDSAPEAARTLSHQRAVDAARAGEEPLDAGAQVDDEVDRTLGQRGRHVERAGYDGAEVPEQSVEGRAGDGETACVVANRVQDALDAGKATVAPHGDLPPIRRTWRRDPTTGACGTAAASRQVNPPSGRDDLGEGVVNGRLTGIEHVFDAGGRPARSAAPPRSPPPRACRRSTAPSAGCPCARRWRRR